MRGYLGSTNGSVVILLGAGASVEAKVAHTIKMSEDINELLDSDDEWKLYKPIYSHLKLLYGKIETDSAGKTIQKDLNIEDLVATIDELLGLLEGTHILYAFFKNWIDLFQNLYGFKDIKEFRNKIEKQLKDWIVPAEYTLQYYKYLLLFAKENPGSGLKVFTLNYDECVQKSFNEFRDEVNGIKLERGFGEEKQGCIWKTKNFDDKIDNAQNTGSIVEKYLFLYQLHGSIDWDRNEKQELIKSNKANIKEIIFGTAQKLKPLDPFLYYAYQFRTNTLSAKLIVVCGYSFFDGYINKILHQALVNDTSKKILICSYLDTAKRERGAIQIVVTLRWPSGLVQFVVGPSSIDYSYSRL